MTLRTLLGSVWVGTHISVPQRDDASALAQLCQTHCTSTAQPGLALVCLRLSSMHGISVALEQGKVNTWHSTHLSRVSLTPLLLSHPSTKPFSKERGQITAAHHLFPKSWRRRGSWKDAGGHTCCTPSSSIGWISQHELMRSKATASWVLLLKSAPVVLGWAEEGQRQLCFSCALEAILLKKQINELADFSALQLWEPWTCLGFHCRPWHRHRQRSPLMWPTWNSLGQISLTSSSPSTATAGAMLLHLITLLGHCKIYLFNIYNALLRAFKIISQVQCLFLRIILLFCNVS